MTTIELNLTEDRTFKVKGKSISFSKKTKRISKYPPKEELSAIWKINGTPVLKIISTIKGEWKIEKNKHKYIFVPKEPSDKKWIVYAFF